MVSNSPFDTQNFDFASLAANLGWIGERNDTTQNNRWLLNYPKLSDGTIPRNAVIELAEFKIYINADYSSNEDDLIAYPCLRDWVASEATWVRWKSGSNWTTAGCGSAGNDYENTAVARTRFSASETVATYKTIAVTESELKKFIEGSRPNYGFLVAFVANSNNSYRFNCGVSSESNLPYWEITWHVPPTPIVNFDFGVV